MSIPENDGCSEDGDPELKCDLKTSLGAGLADKFKYCGTLSVERAASGCSLVRGDASPEVF